MTDEGSFLLRQEAFFVLSVVVLSNSKLYAYWVPVFYLYESGPRSIYERFLHSLRKNFVISFIFTVHFVYDNCVRKIHLVLAH